MNNDSGSHRRSSPSWTAEPGCWQGCGWGGSVEDSPHPDSPHIPEGECFMGTCPAQHQLGHFLLPRGTQGISTSLWTVISNRVIKGKRGEESCLPASSITSRDIGASLIKIRRLGFQLMRHSIPAAQSRVLGGSVNAVSRVMACVIPMRISGHTQCWRLTSATQRRSLDLGVLLACHCSVHEETVLEA